MQKGVVRSPVLVLVFSIITCGIYLLYWIYKVSEETQTYSGSTSTSPGVEVLLCMFTCGIYNIYWFYKYSKLVSECQQKAGLQPDDNALICLLLPIFGLATVSALIMQTSLNKVWESGNSWQ